METQPIEYRGGPKAAPPERCTECGSTQTVAGKMVDLGFVPDLVRKVFFRVSNHVGVFGVACMACGHLRLKVDRRQLTDIAEPPATADQLGI